MRITNHILYREDGTPYHYVESPNKGGKIQPEYLIMHYTAGRSAEASVAWLTNPDAKASAHLVIGRDGSITQLVPFDTKAWHAGRSYWEGLEGMNAFSLGIELDNAGPLTKVGEKYQAWFGKSYPESQVLYAKHKLDQEPQWWHNFPREQIEAAQEVAMLLVQHYKLRDVIGHEDIAPAHKRDPGPAFPMADFREGIFAPIPELKPRPPEELQLLLLSDEVYMPAADPLGFDEVASSLSALIRASKDSTPLTVGVRAAWGMGKSTLMYKLREHLAIDSGTETVWFNAWTLEGENILEGLIKSVLAEIDPNILRRTLRNTKLVATTQLVVSMIAGWLGVGNIVDRLWNAVATDPRVRNQLQGMLKDAMADWLAKVPQDSTSRLLIVFIDDLDRCSPENVFRVFEAIKLYLSAQGFVFVIGFDPSIVSKAILEEKKYSEEITSVQYLDKIIQIDYNVPRPNEAQISALFKDCVEASGTEKLLGEEEEALIIEGSNRNPRRIKRFINRFILEYELDEESWNLKPQLLIKILMLQMYFGDFCSLFKEHSDKNPITQFIDYHAVRIGQEEWNSPKARKLMKSYGIPPPKSLEALDGAQSALDNKVPKEFRDLLRNSDFLWLIESFDERERDTVLRRLLRQRAAGQFLRAEEEAIYEVDASVLNIRTDPSTKAPELMPPLKAGTRLALLSREAAWAFVNVLDLPEGTKDTQGWVFAKYIRRVA